jgi:tetratricopeptide (TPR) repeat protein
MNNYTDIILKYCSGEMTHTEQNEFKHFLRQNGQLRKEFAFQKKLDQVMKQGLLLDAIENDPDLAEAEILARKDIDTYLNKVEPEGDNKDINNKKVDEEVELQIKIAKAEVEMALSGIDDISEVWVKDFEQGRPTIGNDVAAQQIVEYVKKSEPFNQSGVQVSGLRRFITRKIVFQVAAAVLVLSMLLFKTLSPSYSGNSVYERYYEPLDANSFRLRGVSREATGKLQEGVDYYLSKDYTKAELAFNELRKMNENLQEVLLFSGLNQMGQGNFPAAINLFNDLLSAEAQFVPEAQWYLGLCYIKTGEVNKARPLMETLSETEGIYKKKAQLILQSLDR